MAISGAKSVSLIVQHLSRGLAAVNIDALYRRYVVMVRNRAVRLLGDPDAAQDVAQEVFMKYLEYQDRAPPPENTAGFLYRMATNACLDRLRVKMRNRPLGEETPAHTTNSMEDRLALEKVLGLVKDDDAQIAVYYYIDGMDQEEIAALIALPRRTVSHHLDRFRARARRLLSLHEAAEENARAG